MVGGKGAGAGVGVGGEQERLFQIKETQALN